MMNKVNEWVLKAMLKGTGKLESLMKEEKGASDIVAIILIIVVIIAAAGIFKTQLTAIVTTVFEQVLDFIK